MVVVMTIAGFAVGFVCACVSILRLKVGTLRIDRSDPDDGPYMFLELSSGVYEVSNRKYVLLDVKNEDFISQK